MTSSSTALIRPFREADRAALVALWRSCGLVVPANDPDRDIDLKRTIDPDGLAIADADGRLIGSVMFGYEGHRGWINYLAVDADHRGTGLGRRLMNHAEDTLRARGCPKINLQVRSTNAGVLAFYAALGFTRDDVVSLGKRL